MNWLSNFPPPNLKAFFGNKTTPDHLWVKCGNCGEMIFHRDIESGQHVCPQCLHHMRIGPKQRFGYMFDSESYETLDFPEVPQDPLKFRDEKRYTDRLKEARNKTQKDDAIETAVGPVKGIETVICVQNFEFMGGSLGMGAGEAIVRSMEESVARKAPFVFFVASGGARMQEGILSLMQMPRTTIAVQMLREARLPYIVVMTNPTTGGVTASYGMLGDIHIAEPDALIGLSGPRVIEQTIREKLPEGFQRSEYLLDHGMVDMVVHRHEMRETIGTLLSVLIKRPEKEEAAAPDLDLRAEADVDSEGAHGHDAPENTADPEDKEREEIPAETPKGAIIETPPPQITEPHPQAAQGQAAEEDQTGETAKPKKQP